MRLERELDAVDTDARELFALLALLGTPAFTLEAAAALRDARWPEPTATDEVIPELAALAPDDLSDTATAEDRLARTAALLGQLVRHSLLRIEGDEVGYNDDDDNG